MSGPDSPTLVNPPKVVLLEAAEKKLFLQAWHLKALAPSESER